MKAKLKRAFNSLNAAALVALIWHIIQNLTGNLNFGTPKVPLLEMTTMAEKLQTAIATAKDGSKLDRAQRDSLAQQAKEMLVIQANYVTMEANGNYEKLVSSGFDLAKAPLHYLVPEVPQDVVAHTGSEKGDVKLRFKHSPGAHTYGMYMAEQDPKQGEPEWVLMGTTTRSRNVISGLESYKPYWFRVQAIGVRGTSLMSGASQAAAA